MPTQLHKGFKFYPNPFMICLKSTKITGYT